MKHQSYLTLLVALLAAFALSSCSETDDSVEEYPDWKKKNEAYFASKYATVKQAIARGDDSWKELLFGDSKCLNNLDLLLYSLNNSAFAGVSCPT